MPPLPRPGTARSLLPSIDDALVRALAEANVVGVVLADAVHIIEANDAFLDMLGHTREAITDRTLDWHEITPPEDRAVSDEAIQQLLDEGFVRPYAKEYFHVDGTRVPVVVGLALLTREPLRVAAFILDRTEEVEARKRVDGILEAIGEAFFALDGQWRFTYVNPQTEEVLAVPAADMLERPIWEVFPETVGSPFEEHYRRAMATGTPQVFEAYFPPMGKWFSVRAYPGKDDLAVFFVDVTERHLLEEERAQALSRLERVNVATNRVSAAVSGDDVARVVLEEALAMTSGVCGVLAVVERTQLVFAHRIGMAESAPGRLPLTADAPMPEAVRTGRPVLLDTREAWLSRYPVGPKGSFSSFVAIPLTSGGRPVGVLGVGYPDEGPPAAAVLDVLSVLAAQGAQGLARAAEYDRAAHAAQTLQRGLLPRELPRIDGLRVASRYHPAGEASEVGGDFYDLLETPAGVLAVVGDVLGKGVEAAVVTGMARHTVRALGREATGAAAILEKLNVAMAEEQTDRFLTAVLALLHRTGPGRFDVEVVSAGHPPPLLVWPRGMVTEVPVSGRVLGPFDDLALTSARVALRPGHALVLFTDGVTEAGPTGATLGLEGLMETLHGGDPNDPEELAQRIDDRVAEVSGGEPRDDRAVVVLSPEALDA